ncbi:MAG: hypothetical protein ACOZAN_02655 [Patescibacteria group bacterium]
MSNVQTTPVIGLPLNVGWSQVVTNSRGSLICAFSVGGNNANNLGRDIAEDLINNEPQGSSDLHNTLLDILAKVRRSNNQLQIACVLLIDGVITLATHQGSILLRRGNKIGRILSSAAEPRIVEGQYKPEDLYVLCTLQGFPYQEEIKIKLSQGFDVDTVITSIVPELHSQNNSSLSAFAFVEVKQQSSPRVVEVETMLEEAEAQPLAQPAITTISRPTSAAAVESITKPDQLHVTEKPSVQTVSQPVSMTSNQTSRSDKDVITDPVQPATFNNHIDHQETTQQNTKRTNLPDQNPVIPTGMIQPGITTQQFGQGSFSTQVAQPNYTDQTMQTATIPLSNSQEQTRPSKEPRSFNLPKISLSPPKIAKTSLGKIGQLRQFPMRETLKKIGLTVLSILRKIWSKILIVLQVTLSLIKFLIAKIRRQPDHLSFRDKNHLRNQLRNLLIVALVLVAFAVAVLWYQWQKNADISAINQELEPYNQRLADAKKLAESDVLQARAATNEVMNGLRSLAEKNQDNKRRFELVKIKLLETQQFSDQIAGLEQMSQLPVFFDLRLVQTGFIINKTEIYEQTGFFLDTEKKQIVKLDLEKKQAKLISLPDATPKPKDMVYGEQAVFLLGDGIRKIANKGEGNITTLKEAGDSDRDGTILTNFGKYLYVFNPEKRNIYRYLIDDSSLSEPIGWLVDKQGLDFAEISSMTIDGDLWLTTKGGEIKKYNKGNRSDFQIIGMEKPFQSNILLFTKENVDNLYIIEPDQKRLVILNKQGQFLREIKSESFASATSLVVTEDNKKVLVISGSIIFEVEI